MQSFSVAKDILPLHLFKINASKVLRQIKETQRPVIITQNGSPAAVLLTPEAFDRFQEREQFSNAVRDGLDDVAAGRVIADDALSRELDQEFGPPDR